MTTDHMAESQRAEASTVVGLTRHQKIEAAMKAIRRFAGLRKRPDGRAPIELQHEIAASAMWPDLPSKPSVDHVAVTDLRSWAAELMPIARAMEADSGSLHQLARTLDRALDGEPVEVSVLLETVEILCYQLESVAREQEEQSAMNPPPAPAEVPPDELQPGETRASDVRWSDGTPIKATTVNGWVTRGLKLDGKNAPAMLSVIRRLPGEERVFDQDELRRFVEHSESFRRANPTRRR